MEKINLIGNQRRGLPPSHAPKGRSAAVIQMPEAALRASDPLGGVPEAVRVIPVGQEPRRQDSRDGGKPDGLNRGGERPKDESHRHSGGEQAKSRRGEIRNPGGFYGYINALQETQVFREETMRHLPRAEICVWLAIHGCQGKQGARISHDRLVELTGTSRRHVGLAIKKLAHRGLLEVIAKGRFRPNSGGERGLASVYRVYPRAAGQPAGEGCRGDGGEATPAVSEASACGGHGGA